MATIEEIVQSLIRELIKEKKRSDAAMSEGENPSKDSVRVTSIDTSIDQFRAGLRRSSSAPSTQRARAPACGS